jgi:transcription initiation factor TFIID subunit 9B
LTSIDFDLVPNKPPPGVKLYDEEVEEIEETESESEEDEDMERADIPEPDGQRASEGSMPPPQEPPQPVGESAPFPISAIATPSDMEMIGTPGVAQPEGGDEEGSDVGDEDGLFAGGDDDEDSDAMEEVQDALDGDGDGPATNGVKRKLQEDDDYD